ncbi:MAG: hypothetical protein ACFB4J_17330 [Elainellaceae cyanobacterium]
MLDQHKYEAMSQDKSQDTVEFTLFTATGAAAGAGVAATVGGMGLAVGGTAVAITAAPVVAAGAVVGVAAYGLKKVVFG